MCGGAVVLRVQVSAPLGIASLLCPADRLLQQSDHRGPCGAAAQRDHCHPRRRLHERRQGHRRDVPRSA